mmetsp:Transcript_5815/g.25783  ORF Transcript_5815/g.25783 Transcript_5815/m.25783 type:complete len:131 (-) Transcript_5815:973-1365(-)
MRQRDGSSSRFVVFLRLQPRRIRILVPARPHPHALALRKPPLRAFHDPQRRLLPAPVVVIRRSAEPVRAQLAPEPPDQRSVEILAPQVRIPRRSQHQERPAAPLQPQHRHVQRAAAQVVHQHRALHVVLV